MGILNRYILRQIAAPALMAVTLVAVIGVAQEIQERVAKLPLAQMTLSDFARLSGYFLPTIVSYLIPVTFMLGILLAFGRFSQNNELVAMKAAGIPLKRLLAPILVVGALLSATSFLVQDRVQPWAVRKVTDLINTELPLRATLDSLPAGIMHEYSGWRVYIGENDREGTLRNVIIVEPGEGGTAATYYAETASLKTDGNKTVLAMTNVRFIPAGESGQVRRLYAEGFRLPVPSIKTDAPPLNRRELTLTRLLGEHAELSGEVERTQSEPLKDELRKQRHEIADRVSLPFACLAVCFAAAPLGARAKRSGRSYTFAVGFGILLLYYVLQMLTTSQALVSLQSEILRAWVPNAVFCGAGIVLLWRVDRV